MRTDAAPSKTGLRVSCDSNTPTAAATIPAIAAPFSSRTMKVGGSFDRWIASNQPSSPLADLNSLNAPSVDQPSSRKATSSTA